MTRRRYADATLDRLAARLSRADAELARQMRATPPGAAHDALAERRAGIRADQARVSDQRGVHLLMDRREPVTADDAHMMGMDEVA